MNSMLKNLSSVSLAVGKVCGLILLGREMRFRAIILTLAICILAAQAVHAQSVPPKQIYQIAKPATVRVIKQVKFEFSVPDVTVNMATLSDSVNTRLRMERMQRDPDKVARSILKELMSNPTRYFQQQGKLITLQDSGIHTSSGSGFLAHPSGYVVTNAHIVRENIEELLAARVTKENLNATLRVMTRTFPELSKLGLREQSIFAAGLRFSYARFCRIHGRHTAKREVKIVMCPAASRETGQTKILSAELVAVGQRWPGKDVAVLKIGGSGFPTVPLGDESRVDVGDQIFALGYPGAAQSSGFADSSLMDATMTSGLISAKKASRGGFTALQTDAALSEGNSGGPVFDRSGKVIGIATAGAGQRAQGINFMVPATVIREFLHQANIRW